MLGPAQAGAGGNNSFKDIVLETFQRFPRDIAINNRTESQTVNTKAQQVWAGEKTWNKTFVANNPNGQVNYIFITGKLLGQDDKMDIDLD